MQNSTTTFHSIITNQSAQPQLENHQWYAQKMGYAHHLHQLHSPFNSPLSKLIYKYSAMAQALSSCDDDILVFADDSSVIYHPLQVEHIIGDAHYWLAENANTQKGDGSFIILRNTPEAAHFVNQALDNLCHIQNPFLDMYSGFELEHAKPHPHSQLLDGQHYPNLLFASFGHALPNVSAFALSLNPYAHPNVHDMRVIEIFVKHLNDSLAHNTRLYSTISDEAPSTTYETTNPAQKIALISSYTPNISSYAQYSAKNIQKYCQIHGYTHYLYRDLLEVYQGKISGNWIKPKLLLNHFASHEQVVWVDSDILIHDLARPLSVATQNHEIFLTRDIASHAFNSGFMAFRNTPDCQAYLERVDSMIDEVADKANVYHSGGDQHYFIQAWHEMGGATRFPLHDSLTANTHPALYDNHTFMLHYMSYPNQLRALVMHADAQMIDKNYP